MIKFSTVVHFSMWKRGLSPIPHLFQNAATFAGLELLEEIVTLVVYQDKCGEVLNLNLPDCLHAKFRVLDALD